MCNEALFDGHQALSHSVTVAVLLEFYKQMGSLLPNSQLHTQPHMSSMSSEHSLVLPLQHHQRYAAVWLQPAAASWLRASLARTDTINRPTFPATNVM